jgi:hypothetical protein
MTGIGQDNEEPTHAELILDGTEPVIENVKILLAAIL